MVAATAEAKILALELKGSQALGQIQEIDKLKQELADLERLNSALEAEKINAEKASADAVATAAAEQRRALASQEQVTAIARELEEVATRTAQQVEAAQEESRQQKQKADAAVAAKEMVRRKLTFVHSTDPWHRCLLPSKRRLVPYPVQALAHAAEADRDREMLRRSFNQPATSLDSVRANDGDGSGANRRMEVSLVSRWRVVASSTKNTEQTSVLSHFAVPRTGSSCSERGKC